MGCASSVQNKVVSTPSPQGSPRQTKSPVDGRVQTALRVEVPQSFTSSPAHALPKHEVAPDPHLQNLKIVAKEGIKATWSLCTTFKDLLPFPGGAGVALIGEIAQLVSTAIANKENLLALHGRATELIVVIVDRHLDVEALEARQVIEGSRLYTNLMHQLLDLLQGIRGYAQSYCDRNFILKLLMIGHDRDTYQAMVDTLGKLLVDAHFSVSVETHSKVLEMHSWTGEMRTMLEDLRRSTPYVDHPTKVQGKVESLGGIEAVLKDAAKLEEVVQHLDTGHQVAVATIQKQVHAGFLAAFAYFDNGVHRLILHTDMRTLWKTFFDKLEKVGWDTWWQAFPGLLPEIKIEDAIVRELEFRFSKGEAKRKFQEFVAKGDPDLSKSISVSEVNMAFPFQRHLLDVIDEALGLAQPKDENPSTSLPSQQDDQPQSGRPSIPSPLPVSWSIRRSVSLLQAAPQSTRRCLDRTVSLHKKLRCSLPYLDRLYTGRDQDAALLQHKLQSQLSSGNTGCKAAVCLVASAGMGKSTLGLDVCWRMAISGRCPAGVQKVDLREAGSYEEVLGRFCSTLGMTMDENTTNEIPAKLRSLCELWKGPLMLLVDNAEAPLAEKEEDARKAAADRGPAKFMSLISMVAREAVLLITSRVPMADSYGISHHTLGGMDNKSCQVLLHEAAPNLSDAEKFEVVNLCRGVPLLVRLAGDALRTGQLSVKEVREAADKDSDTINAITKLMLQSLSSEHQQYLAQLGTFPSGFDEAGAAAVLDWDMPRASSLLVVLWKHELVSWDASNNTYSLHPMVRACAVEMMRRVLPEVVRQARVRFVAHVFREMDSWASMYNTTAWAAPLTSVRERGPDIRAAFALARDLLQMPAVNSASEKLLEVVLGVDIESIRPMLRAGGIRYSSTWHLLDKFAVDKCTGNEQLLPAALYISHLLRRHEHEGIERALQIRERLLHRDHPRTLSCLHALAEAMHLQTRYKAAEPLFQESMDARQRVLGPNHPHTLDSIEGLAECMSDQGRYKEAEPLLKDVVKGREEVLGKLHPRTLESNTNVAKCYGKQGHQAAAEELHKKNLQARKDVLGPDHLKTYDSMNSLATCLRQQGKTAEALPLLRETLAGRRRILGNDNPATHDSLQNYANCVSDEGGAAEAEEHYREVLIARQLLHEKLEGNHRSVFESKNNLATCLHAQGKWDDAEKLYREALEGRRSILGSNPDTFQSMNNLARLLSDQGRHEAAEPLWEAARAGQEQLLGLGHPDTITLNKEQANRLRNRGKHAEAEVLLRAALEGIKQLMETGKGDSSNDMGGTVADCTYALANCLQAQAKDAEAEPLFRFALEERSRFLPSGHSDRLKSTAQLAHCLWNLKKYDTAEPLYRAAFEGQRQAFGLGHPATMPVATDLAKCLQLLEKYADAEDVFRLVTEELYRQKGLDNADTLAAAEGLAACLSKQGEVQVEDREAKITEAKQWLEKVYYARERLLGPNHPETMRSLDDLIDCHKQQGNLAATEMYKQKKVECLLHAPGQNDGEAIAALVSLGFSLFNQGKFKEAELQYKQALEGYTKTLGGDDLDTLDCLAKLARSVYNQEGREQDALPLFEEALEKHKRILGADHPDTLRVEKGRNKCADFLK